MKVAKIIFYTFIAIQGTTAVTRSKDKPSQEENSTYRSTTFPDWKGKRQRTRSNNQQVNRVPASSLKRQRKKVKYNESTSSSSSSSDTLQEKYNKSTASMMTTSTQEPKKWRPAGYYKHEEIAKRTAIKYINEGRFKNKKEALKQAWSDLREKKRLDSLKRRIRNKNKGIKDHDFRRPGRNQKEDVIRRKIVRLLGENNNVVRHETARKLAEEEYARQNREYSANYRLQKQINSSEKIEKGSK